MMQQITGKGEREPKAKKRRKRVGEMGKREKEGKERGREI